jgi:hypothetical protein
MFNKVLTIVGLFGWSVYASAATILPTGPNYYNLDVAGNNPILVNHVNSATAFTDIFSFTVPNPNVGRAAAVALDLTFLNLKNISGLNVFQDTTYQSSPITFSVINTVTTPARVVEPSAYLSGSLNPGSYVFDVTGIANGIFGGSYTAGYALTPLVTPVPLPPPLAMFASGFLGLGALRRKKVQA